jgi:hypothetical protein
MRKQNPGDGVNHITEFKSVKVRKTCEQVSKANGPFLKKLAIV